jgi:glycerol-3-phosphate dehydrogenase
MISNTFSAKSRQHFWQRLTSEEFDLCIIGGGINGAGVARDAALRGMKVALIEAQDFASGTSSRSSKLVHGGIRYLENLEFHLVFEALSERQKLFSIAPHLVHPLRFMIPLYQGGRVGTFKMSLGMWLYDALSLFQAPEMHEKLNVEHTLQRLPELRKQDLLGSFVYSDAYMDDDLLVHETIRSAVQYNAAVLNYVKAVEVQKNSVGKIESILIQNNLENLTGVIKAKHFISTVGPWTDILAKSFFPDWNPVLRPTKGVHLTFERSRVPLNTAVVMAAEERIVFGIPRHDMVIIGTTDTDYKGDPSDVSVLPEDVSYLLGVVEKYFPGVNITQKDIVGAYAGVRPLVKDEAGSEGKTSREHSIWTDSHDLTYVAGGKYTTYRLIAKQVVEHCLKFFSFDEKVKFANCLTNQPLNPFINEDSYQLRSMLKIEMLAQNSNLSSQDVDLLLDRHGHEALEMIRNYGAKSIWELEAHHAINNSMCLNLIDFFIRRTPLVLAHVDHGKKFISLVCQVFAEELGWSKSKIESEKDKLTQFLNKLDASI